LGIDYNRMSCISIDVLVLTERSCLIMDKENAWNGLNSLKEKFSLYYENKNIDIFGNNLNKDTVSPLLPHEEYNNFFKWCRIIQLLVYNGFIDIGKYRILDAGCGNGQDLRKFMEIGAAVENCYGIDFSEKALEFAVKHSPAAFSYKACDLDKTGYADAFFDIIVSFNTIVNYHDDDYIKRIADEFRRVIRPGGLLLLITVLTSESWKKTGLIDIPTRGFTLDEIKTLFGGFEVRQMFTASSRFSIPTGGRLDDSLGNPIKLELFSNLYNYFVNAKKYESFYLEGAVNHLCSGLELLDTPTKILALSAVK